MIMVFSTSGLFQAKIPACARWKPLESSKNDWLDYILKLVLNRYGVVILNILQEGEVFLIS